jgi:arginyl-tRNA synthetase
MSGAAAPDLKALVRSRVRAAAVAAGWGDAVPAEAAIVVELPREFAHGDLACPVAFALAKAVRRPPPEVATAIKAHLAADASVERVEIAGGGYLNFFLGDAVWAGILGGIEASGPAWGNGTALAGERILVEFVSANPTGPLVVVNARAASFGAALCRVIEAAGATVGREYYVNDAGAQVRNLALSVEARWRELRGEPFEIPKDGYQGDYIRDLAQAARGRLGDDLLKADPEERIRRLMEFSVGEMVVRHRADLDRLRVGFDAFFHEKRLHEEGLVAQALADLTAKGEVFEKDGAKWFRATAHGDEKDRVLIKGDGNPTYTLPDVAYHRQKFSRGFTRLIDIVGADHQVEMATLRSALAAVGEPVERFEVIITQFVTLKRGSETVKMSKRSGDIVTLAELVDEVGPDAARFLFLLRAPSSHLEFDMDLAKATTMDNPVYYVQYAYARLCSVVERSKAEGLGVPSAADGTPARLVEPEARLLLRKLARWPLIVEKAALTRAPHLVAHELTELAQAVHQFYSQCRVVGAPAPELARARLALVAAARQTISNGLALLGVTAPERM